MLETIIEFLKIGLPALQANTVALEANTAAQVALTAAINKLNGDPETERLTATLGGVTERPPVR